MRALDQTKPWVLFLSILGFIGSGFAALGAMVWGAMAMFFSDFSGGLGAIMGITALTGAGGAVLYFFASYHLFTYSSEISKFLRTKESLDLERALTAQKSFWKLVGIVTAVVLALYLLLIPLSIMMG